MALRFLPGYEQDIEPGAGHSSLPGRRKVILHTTESGPGSLKVVRDSWRGGYANWAKGLPHFISEGSRFVQCLPLDTCAYTSKGGPDNANKVGTPIQIEIVHRAADPLSDVEYEALGKWIADLAAAGIELDLDQCPKFYGANEGIILATESSPVRQIITNQFGGYGNFNGLCGHQHLRGNDHWDPGRVDIKRVCDIARGQGDEIDMAAKDEILDEIRRARDAQVETMVNIQSNLANNANNLAHNLAVAIAVAVETAQNGASVDEIADKVSERLVLTRKDANG